MMQNKCLDVTHSVVFVMQPCTALSTTCHIQQTNAAAACLSHLVVLIALSV